MNKVLICYFSFGGSTTKIANSLHTLIKESDLVEIKPKTPYSKKDVNYLNPLSRCNKEIRSKKDIPLIDNIKSIDEYGTIYIGFPIWYWKAPIVISSFVKQFDWSNKKVLLFMTSGSSPVGKTVEKLTPFMQGNVNIVDAKRFDINVNENELKEFIKKGE